MMVSVYCKKCDTKGMLDIGSMSKEQVEEILKNKDSFECFGHHVELTSPLEFWEIDWENPVDSKSPTEEEFLNDLKSKYKEVYTPRELSNKYTIDYFNYGLCGTTNKENGEKVIFDFTQSPSGIRYYFH